MKQQDSITNFQAIQPNNKGLINAKDLHEALNIKTYYTTWFNRVVEDYGFIANKDFFSNLKETINGRPQNEYQITIGMAKEMS